MKPFVRANMRALAAFLAIASSACASARPTPRPWVPGSYQFQVSLHGEMIFGVIEVNDDGPFSVETSLSRCVPRLGQVYQPWDRSRTFDCAGDHRVLVSFGTVQGLPIAGTMSNTRTVMQDVSTKTCIKTVTDEAGASRCVEWHEEVHKEDRRVTETARILIVSPGPARSGGSSGSPRAGE